MIFLPPTAQGAYSQVRHQYLWQDNADETSKHYTLYRGGEPVAQLHLAEQRSTPAFISIGNESYMFQDASTFFWSCLQLVQDPVVRPVAWMRQFYINPREGLITIGEQKYTWRFPSHPAASFMLMNPQREKLFSYHYQQGSVRLLMNGYGGRDKHIILLLCIGLYLLPLWHEKQMSIA